MARMAHKSAHLELRYRTWYAVLVVPKHLRDKVGKSKFFQSTQTSDRYQAELTAASLVKQWKTQINAAGFSTGQEDIDAALNLLQELKNSNTPGRRQLVLEVIDEEADNVRRELGTEGAEIFKNIATGKTLLLKSLHDQWLEYQKSRNLTMKNIEQMTRDLEEFYKNFETVDQLTADNVESWINSKKSDRQTTPASFNRRIGSYRNFHKFLMQNNYISRASKDPFFIPDEYRISSGGRSKTLNKTQSWVPYTHDELVHIHAESKNSKNHLLQHLIVVAAYTGCRIEELCSLETKDIDFQEMSFKVVDAKTESGIRTIPIHSRISTVFTDLANKSTDAYLFSGLSENKYGDRSNAIGKTFGRLKKQLGFGPRHVFHSIRKTVSTAFENSGITENIAADIIGHDKPRLTYGLYSGGASMDVKRDAIEKLSFNFS